MEQLFIEMKNAVQDGDDEAVSKLVKEGLAGGLGAREILEKGMMPAMQEIGEKFSRNEVYISELLVAAEAMNAGVDLLEKASVGTIRNKGKIILGTVEGDLHTIGKNLVRICLEGAGYTVEDLGENIKARQFADAYAREKPAVLGLSALLSSTALCMEDVIREVRGVVPSAKIIVGGAPVTQAFAEKIGASGYAPNAFEAVQLVEKLLH